MEFDKERFIKEWEEDKARRQRSGVHYVSDLKHPYGVLSINPPFERDTTFSDGTMGQYQGYFATDENNRQIWGRQGSPGNLEEGICIAELLFKRCTIELGHEDGTVECIEWFTW